VGIKRSATVGVQVVDYTARPGEHKYGVNVYLERMQWKQIEVDYPIELGDALALALVELKLAGVDLNPI
jgi:hypothetical protein